MSSKLFIEKQVVGIYAENCYIVADLESNECAVIDPGADFKRLLSRVQDKGFQTKFILLTHGHFDHIGAVTEMKHATGAEIYVNFGDAELYQNAFIPDKELSDGEKLYLGEIEIRVITTPGHTQGGVCFYLPSEKILFAGDTLFYRSVGRTDLPGGNHKQLIQNIITKLMVLPDDVIVYPGHSAKTTIGDERRHNLFIQG